MKKNDRNRGFTLVEILVVIGIMGILAAMSAYSWQRYVANADLRTAARDLASEISLYRQKAMGENTTYTMTFEIDNNRYTVAPGTIVKSFADFGSGMRLNTITFTGGAINIQPRGLLNNGTITLANTRGSSAAVTVNQTGRTHVEFNMQ